MKHASLAQTKRGSAIFLTSEVSCAEMMLHSGKVACIRGLRVMGDMGGLNQLCTGQGSTLTLSVLVYVRVMRL